MNTQKKRIAAYFLFVCIGFLGAFLLLRNKNVPSGDSVPKPVKKDSLISVSLFSESFDLENNSDGYISTEKAASGKKSCKLSSSMEYGFSIVKTIKDIPSFGSLTSITLKFKCLAASKEDNALYVFAINDAKGKNVFWDGKPFVCSDENAWLEQSAEFLIAPELLDPENKITLYAWNRNKKEFFIDDISVDFIGTAVYRDTPAAQSEATNLFFDFETDAGSSSADNVKETIAHSGKKACDLSGGKEFGPTINKKISEIGNKIPKKISMSVWVYPLSDNVNVVLTASVVNSKNETVFWEGKSSENKSFPKNKWTKINASYFLPIEKIAASDIIGVGLWNKGKTDVIIDDLEIVYGEGSERRGSPSKVDATAIYEKRFVGEKNKPPFNTIFFQRQEINNANSVSITPFNKQNITDNFSPNDEFLVGDFFPEKNNLDEVLCLKVSGQGLFSYSPESKQFKKLWDNTNAEDSLWNNKNNVYPGDFNADGKMDILLVDKKNNDWKIIDFNGKRWIVISKGKDPKSEWIRKKETQKNQIVGPSDIVFPGNYYGNKQTFLKLNTDWRFDLKLVEKDGNGYTILGNVDFKGYPDDHNPKYYEFVKIIPGRFLSKDQTALIVVMFNCADQKFDGKNCKQTEDLSFLPNSIQLYRIEQK